MTETYSIVTNLGRRLSFESRHKIRWVQRLWARITCGTSLAALAQYYHSDKNEGHHYTIHYESHFRFMRRQRLRVLEIGIGGYAEQTFGGCSLRMWRDYFPRSMIYGIDIFDKKCHDERRIKTFRGDQTDISFLQSVLSAVGTPDIIIDDGSHQCSHVIATFKVLFPALAPTGIYVIEDTQTSYWEEYGGCENNRNDPRTTMGFFKSLTDGLNVDEYRDPAYEATYFDRHITAIHFYHNLIFVQKGLNNEGSNLHSCSEARSEIVPRGST